MRVRLILPGDILYEAAVPEFPKAVVGISAAGLVVAFVSISPSTRKPRINVMTDFDAVFDPRPPKEVNLHILGHVDSVENLQGRPILSVDDFTAGLMIVHDTLDPQFRAVVKVAEIESHISILLQRWRKSRRLLIARKDPYDTLVDFANHDLLSPGISSKFSAYHDVGA